MYSNSSFDQDNAQDAASHDQSAVRSMYEQAPYPGLGAGLKDASLFLSKIEGELAKRPTVRFLDAGCGTGHYLVGVAKRHPEWHCSGIDLSQASLDVATELAALHGATVELQRGSYLDPLPFDRKFDVIFALGTVHHCDDPLAALRNLNSALADDGYLLLHVYGLRLDRRKFDLKEMLSIFEPDLSNIERRFFFYDALMRHRRRNWLRHLVQMPLIDIYAGARNWFRNLLRKSRGTVWSPPHTVRYDEPSAPWIDHFCHPCERAYEVPEVLDLIEHSGFKIDLNLGHGREYPQLIPPEWRPEYDQLSLAAKARLSELLAFGGGSFRLVLRKQG